MNLRVNEIYGPTIQGEGATAGRPCFFLRLAGCNLHCRWCDTFYTWNYEGTQFAPEHDYGPKVKKEDEVYEMSVDDVAWALQTMRRDSSGINRVIVSGGEPLLQQAALTELCARLVKDDFIIEVETNGTIIPAQALSTCVAFNCSPKLSHSGNVRKLRYNEKALYAIKTGGPAIFKFVVSTEDDITEVKDIIAANALPSDAIYLMPLGHTPELQRETELEVVELCKKYGYSYSPRLHIALWGNQRGI